MHWDDSRNASPSNYGIIMLLAVISLPNKIQPAQYDMR